MIKKKRDKFFIHWVNLKNEYQAEIIHEFKHGATTALSFGVIFAGQNTFRTVEVKLFSYVLHCMH